MKIIVGCSPDTMWHQLYYSISNQYLTTASLPRRQSKDTGIIGQNRAANGHGLNGILAHLFFMKLNREKTICLTPQLLKAGDEVTVFFWGSSNLAKSHSSTVQKCLSIDPERSIFPGSQGETH